jgi:hypothetical protein
MNAFALAFAMVTTPAAPTEYTVESIQQKSVFAGKLGYRITETAVLVAGNQRTQKVVATYHSRFGQPKARVLVGSKVRL